jgi:hypothetical protein
MNSETLSWDLNMNSFSRFDLAKPKNKKKYSGHQYCFFWSTKRKTSIPSWSRPRYTESVNNLAKDGVNTTIIFWCGCRSIKLPN